MLHFPLIFARCFNCNYFCLVTTIPDKKTLSPQNQALTSTGTIPKKKKSQEAPKTNSEVDEAEKKNLVDDIGNVNTLWTFKKDQSCAKFSHSKLLVENTGGLCFYKTRLNDEQDRLRIAIDLNRRLFHEYVRTIRVLEELLRINLEKQMQLRVSIEFLKSGKKEEKRKS